MMEGTVAPPAIAIEILPLDDLPPTEGPSWRQRMSEAELAYCLGRRRAREHLGARLAAKQAVGRLLGWSAESCWSEVQILRTPGSPPSVSLTGGIAASQGRALAPGVSLTHAAGYAAALAWRRSG
jgi:holo-[acyl-carrier protein] synthase